ncbi:unnamed protein product [Dibothriocephalus latus]|uniref:Uncharacterized protein n=1 Tax=Dibothriocephalus latus TaxID=60516 RepID=A0A3P7RBI4_DIBLA|nr:unnamed protein product [Dibothriocephalus latus]
MKVYIELLSDCELESSRENEATLDELMRVNEKINVNIQQFQSFQKMRLGQQESFDLYDDRSRKHAAPAV